MTSWALALVCGTMALQYLSFMMVAVVFHSTIDKSLYEDLSIVFPWICNTGSFFKMFVHGWDVLHHSIDILLGRIGWNPHFIGSRTIDFVWSSGDHDEIVDHFDTAIGDDLPAFGGFYVPCVHKSIVGVVPAWKPVTVVHVFALRPYFGYRSVLTPSFSRKCSPARGVALYSISMVEDCCTPSMMRFSRGFSTSGSTSPMRTWVMSNQPDEEPKGLHTIAQHLALLFQKRVLLWFQCKVNGVFWIEVSIGTGHSTRVGLNGICKSGMRRVVSKKDMFVRRFG